MKQVSKKRSVMKGGAPFVVLPLELWERIEDVLAELASPRLAKQIAQERAAYKSGRALPYSRVRKQLGLA